MDLRAGHVLRLDDAAHLDHVAAHHTSSGCSSLALAASAIASMASGMSMPNGASSAPVAAQYSAARARTTVRYPGDTSMMRAPMAAASRVRGCRYARMATTILACVPSSRATCAKAVWAPPSAGLA